MARQAERPGARSVRDVPDRLADSIAILTADRTIAQYEVEILW
ncbi:MAG: hypothetical protein WCK58_03760 [Chloroflexota bacterium]